MAEDQGPPVPDEFLDDEDLDEDGELDVEHYLPPDDLIDYLDDDEDEGDSDDDEDEGDSDDDEDDGAGEPGSPAASAGVAADRG